MCSDLWAITIRFWLTNCWNVIIRLINTLLKRGNHQKYQISDAVMSAFSVFFSQSLSFLDAQEHMQKKYNKNNAQSIFGVHQLPSTS